MVANGACARWIEVNVSLGPAIGRIGAAIAAMIRPASHTMASHAPSPRRFFLAGGTPAVTPATPTVNASATRPVVSRSSARAVPADSGGCDSGMADPGVEDRVDAVDERVEHDERDGDEGDVGLHCRVLARAHGGDEPEPHAGKL